MNYQPSSSERKTVILVYLLIGIMMILHKDRLSQWVWSHTQQALGRRVAFVCVALLSVFLVFIPIVQLLPALFLIALLGIWGWFVYSAWQSSPASGVGGMSVFVQLGKRMTDVMDISPQIIDSDSDHTTSEDNT